MLNTQGDKHYHETRAPQPGNRLSSTWESRRHALSREPSLTTLDANLNNPHTLRACVHPPITRGQLKMTTTGHAEPNLKHPRQPSACNPTHDPSTKQHITRADLKKRIANLITT